MTNWKSALYQSIINTPLESWISELQPQLAHWENEEVHADTKKWQNQLGKLPKLNDVELELKSQVKLSTKTQFSEANTQYIKQVLKQFMPWRKGPFDFFGIDIDTEWRSDWKWDRVLPHINELRNKRVLDVGCGSGYHLFRMYGEASKQVIGIDPTTLFFYQFHVFKQYMRDVNVHFVPLGIEQMPSLRAFDTVFSMGVLYHRKDPLKFLQELKNQLVQGGQLVLETLVVEGGEQTVLMPQDRYAQMRNVWFLPSVDALKLWMKRIGFKDIKVVDISQTSVEEQRSTQWMQNHSLEDFLCPDDKSKTIEGYPAPLRATMIASI